MTIQAVLLNLVKTDGTDDREKIEAVRKAAQAARMA